MIQNNEYIEFLKTRKKNDIILIKNEIKDDIKKLNKDIKKNKFQSLILKNKFLYKVFGKKVKIESINLMAKEKYNKKRELYTIVKKYLKELND